MSKRFLFLDKLNQRHPTIYFFADLFVNIFVVVLLVYTVRTYFISPFQVYGPSMCNTLNYLSDTCQEGFGEYLIVNKAVYYPFLGNRYRMPERGDIVVFRPPHNPNDYYIKRVIGLPGEKVKISSGRVFVFNKEHPAGFELPEVYLNKENAGKTFPVPAHLAATYEVPEDEFFVLGDNRRKSTDSRACFRGIGDSECADPQNHFLKMELIEGKAWVVLWPFHRMRLLANPDYAEGVK